MDWFLIESDEDKSFSIVHHSFVLNAGAVKKSDTVTFFYRNKPFIGTIISSGDREALNEELEKLGHEAKRTTKDPAEDNTSKPVLGKRRSTRPERYGQADADNTVPSKKAKSKKPSEDLQKKNLVESKRKQSHGLTNQDIINWMDKTKPMKPDGTDDKEWEPSLGHGSDDSSSNSSTSSDLVKLTQSSAVRKAERVNIIKGNKSLSPSTSPTKEALKMKLRNAELKLQMLYDAEGTTAMKKSSEKEDAEDSDGKEKNINSEIKERVDSNDKAKSKKSSERTERQDSHDKEKNEKSSDRTGLEASKHIEKNDKSSERMERKDSNDTELDMKSGESTDRQDGTIDMNDGFQGPDHDTSVRSETQGGKSGDNISDIFNDDEGKDQLFGKSPGFVQLADDIYCHKEVVREALSQSTNVCHIARRLLVGVFKPESLQTCTLTGQEWRASPGDKNQSSEGLYRPAVNAIIEYARTAAAARKWKVSKENGKIKHSMACRLCELKSLIKKNGIDIIKKKYLR